MINPIIIRKDPKKYENLMNEVSIEEYNKLTDSVDLLDIIEFVKDLNNQSWVHKCYWKNLGEDISTPFYSGEMQWAIYSYLVDRKLLLIEDQYLGYSPSRTEKYRDKAGYFNPLEATLFTPILNRMLKEGYLSYDRNHQRKGYYTINKSFLREDKLNELGI